jgi:transglutaminase-like putative cysteine protease
MGEFGMMQRRDFVNTVCTGLAGMLLPARSFAQLAKKGVQNPGRAQIGPWKNVEITTKISAQAEAGTEVWIPVPAAETSYQELVSTSWDGNFTRATLAKDKTYAAPFFYGIWDKPGLAEVNVSYRVRLRNRSQPEPLRDGEDDLYLRPTKHVPLDGAVKTTALKIVKSETNADRKAQLIYRWIVENTFRDPAVLGCGVGDIKSMLETGNLGGKCADLSSLFVGLCRAVGIPAREAFGLRVLPSENFKSIGKYGDISKGQHCRAEYFSKNRGWIPVDPADVRKVILEEKLSLGDVAVQNISEKFFGSWEPNWVVYNSARDFMPSPTARSSVNYFMYPRLESGKFQNDGMDPEHFKYNITSTEISEA